MSAHIETNDSDHSPCCSMNEGGGHCPMASKFEATFGSERFANRLKIIGTMFILLGVIIIIWPIVVVWLTAAVSILLGVLVLMASSLLKKMNQVNW